MKKSVLAAAISMGILVGCTTEVDEHLQERMATAALKAGLFDPESLQIKSVTHHEWCGKGTEDGIDLPVMKIVYNAKNRFGGYVGFKTAYWSPRTANLNTSLDGLYGIPALAYELAMDRVKNDPDTDLVSAASEACEKIIDGRMQ